MGRSLETFMAPILEGQKHPSEKLSITTKDVNLAKTVLTIVRAELKNWGYSSSEITPVSDSWGECVLQIEVKQGD